MLCDLHEYFLLDDIKRKVSLLVKEEKAKLLLPDRRDWQISDMNISIKEYTSFINKVENKEFKDLKDAIDNSNYQIKDMIIKTLIDSFNICSVLLRPQFSYNFHTYSSPERKKRKTEKLEKETEEESEIERSEPEEREEKE